MKKISQNFASRQYNPTLSLRTPAHIKQGLETFAASQQITRSAAASMILEEWLRTHGWIELKAAKPSGPATDVVAAMDEAIKKDRVR